MKKLLLGAILLASINAKAQTKDTTKRSAAPIQHENKIDSTAKVATLKDIQIFVDWIQNIPYAEYKKITVEMVLNTLLEYTKGLKK